MYEELIQRLREESEIERWLQPHSANETPKLLDDAADAIEELEKAFPRWIPVTERLPEEKELVLGYTPHDGYMFVGYRQRWTSNRWDWLIVTARGSTKTMKKRVTHWMPLPSAPEPPKEET